jgi:ubiquitin C-terminal hydrolase
VVIDQLCEDFKDSSRGDGQIRQAAVSELENLPLKALSDYWWGKHLAQNASFFTSVFCGQMISTIQCTGEIDTYCAFIRFVLFN